MEIIQNFGFEPMFFTAQVINFLILAAIFKRFLYKPVLGMLKTREKVISQGLKDAESAQKSLNDAEVRKDEIIRAATIQAERIIEETKKSAEEMRTTLTEGAKSESQKIISEARSAAEAEFQNAQIRARDLSLDLARDILDKVVSQVFTREEKVKIMERGVSRLKNYDRP